MRCTSITQLAKLSVSHSIGRTRSWRICKTSIKKILGPMNDEKERRESDRVHQASMGRVNAQQRVKYDHGRRLERMTPGVVLQFGQAASGIILCCNLVSRYHNRFRFKSQRLNAVSSLYLHLSPSTPCTLCVTQCSVRADSSPWRDTGSAGANHETDTMQRYIAR